MEALQNKSLRAKSAEDKKLWREEYLGLASFSKGQCLDPRTKLDSYIKHIAKQSAAD